MKLRLILALAAAPLVLNATSSGAATRNYDCTKAGNANKSACKTAAPKPVVPAKPKAAATTAPKPRNYDCSKAGNANKAACKSKAAPATVPAKPAHPRASTAPAAATGPQGATAKCRDNTYSHSKDHKGACSHHGGIANWY